MNTSLPILADIRNPALTQALQHKLDNKTKPLGSLGRIDQWHCSAIPGTSHLLEQPANGGFCG